MRLVTVARLLIFLAIILLIHFQHDRDPAFQTGQQDSDARMLSAVQGELPDAVSVAELSAATRESLWNGGSGSVFPLSSRLREVRSDTNHVIAVVVETSPTADSIMGFSGPTNLLLIADPSGLLRHVRILSSEDTPDHVRQIEEDADFFRQLCELHLRDLTRGQSVDAVTGATLTSLAIQESLHLVLQDGSGSAADQSRVAVSLRFPAPPSLSDVQVIFPAATEMVESLDGFSWAVMDAIGQQLGTVIRSVPAAENLAGYQGPTETIVGLRVSSGDQVSAESEIVGIAVGVSYDNEPHVTWVRDDSYFREIFRGRSLRQLADPESGEFVEGVSGATMTSQTIAEGLQLAAAQTLSVIEEKRLAEVHRQQKLRLDERQRQRAMSTMGICLCGVVIGLTRLRGAKRLRVGFQLILILWLGLINGDLISQALLLGWIRNGVSWERTGGLLCLALAAVLVPLTTGRNVYCSHLCPHGAVQQLIRNRLPWRLSLGRRLQRFLKLIPLLLLGWVVVVAMLHLSFSAAAVEPFDGWVWSVAGVPAIGLLVSSLAVSAVSPMAYCRYGCPTGAVLGSLSAVRRAGWQRRDTAALLLLLIAVVCLMFDS